MADSPPGDSIALFSEILVIDQLVRNRVGRVLPKGMELSHFTVLNHLSHVNSERTPAQLAKAFHLSRGAMTNTLAKLEAAGFVHIRPDWDDARRKFVSVSPAGRLARDQALAGLTPVINGAVEAVGTASDVRALLPALRALRGGLAVEKPQ